MPIFTNRATLSYGGKTTDSNTVTGNLRETLAITKTALSSDYQSGDDITYVVSLTNTGNVSFTNLTLTDNLGEYTLGDLTLTPTDYIDGSIYYLVNGVETAPPTVTSPPLAISGVNVPSGGNAILVYRVRVNEFAPLAEGEQIENTVTVSGGGLSADLTASASVFPSTEASLSISKSLCPVEINENGVITYTFVIQNSGASEVVATDNAVITDTFDPVLEGITVTYNDAVWPSSNYTYDEITGVFTTAQGSITVPAATFTRAADGSVIISPGVTVITVSGTI